MRLLFNIQFLCLSIALLILVVLLTIESVNCERLDPIKKSTETVLQAHDVGVGRSFWTGTASHLSKIDSSMRGLFTTPLTALVYLVSIGIGVVVVLAFYESPISPLPVPPLPSPPVGRFPPEHPIWPPPSKHAVRMPYNQGYGASPVHHPIYAPGVGSNGLYHKSQQQYGASNLIPSAAFAPTRFNSYPQFSSISRNSYEPNQVPPKPHGVYWPGPPSTSSPAPASSSTTTPTPQNVTEATVGSSTPPNPSPNRNRRSVHFSNPLESTISRPKPANKPYSGVSQLLFEKKRRSHKPWKQGLI